MFVQVKLLNGFPKPLLYAVPESWQDVPAIGSLVHVPLRAQIVPAMVMSHHESIPSSERTFLVKQVHSRDTLPEDKNYLPFIQKLSTYYHIEPYSCIKRIRHFLSHEEEEKEAMLFTPKHETTDMQVVQLTDEQQLACNRLLPLLEHSTYSPVLLHGVTGSGKTEIYKMLILQAIKQGKSIMLLLPEVSLALQFERLLRAQLPQSLGISSFHSATRIAHKKELWQKVRAHHPQLIIGVHLPTLLPVGNLGLIIVDEEHECGYQEKKYPRINSKEAALLRAQQYNIPIVLGSATPSVSSLYNVEHRNWLYITLKERYRGSFPSIQTVYLTEKNKRRTFWISQELDQAVADRLSKHEQIIIFLNRRGFSFFVQCALCSFIPRCSACSVSLTYHENNILSCHYCGHSQAQPPFCLGCKADESHLLKKGIGTQQVVSILQKLHPTARIGRADLDVSSHKKLWHNTIADFEAGNLDILVGTQTITKGFHFPRVTLVGILWADVNLNFPTYNASEVTMQQLLQVAGRAGRHSKKSDVIVQAMAEHALFDLLHETDYLQFFQQEMESRMAAFYPPCARLYEIEVRHCLESIVEDDAQTVVFLLQQHAKIMSNLQILGPSRPPVHKIKNMCIRKIYIKAQSTQLIDVLITKINFEALQSTLFITPNPIY